MSPSNYSSDTAQFFADLNKTYNSTTIRRITSTKEKSSIASSNFSNHINAIRGNLGSRLSKLKIKPDMNSGSIRNKSANSTSTYKETMGKKILK
jgi:hypothetical protein